MNVLYLLIPLALLLAGGFLMAFIWATRSGQMEDLDSAPYRILFETKSKNLKPAPKGENHE